MSEVLGVERRRRWSEDERLEILPEVCVGRASVRQVAQRHQITRSQIYGWRRDLKKNGLWSPDRGAVFMPLDFDSCAGPASAPASVSSDRAAAEQPSLPDITQRQRRRSADRLIRAVDVA